MDFSRDELRNEVSNMEDVAIMETYCYLKSNTENICDCFSNSFAKYDSAKHS